MYDLVMTLWKQYANSFSINYHYIKYEDVVMNFDKSINNLLNFLEIPWSKNVLKFYNNIHYYIYNYNFDTINHNNIITFF